MSRNKGTFNFAANFEPLVKAPIDARMKVGSFTDLTDPSTWADADGNVWLYKGIIVVVADDPSAGIYYLSDESNYTSSWAWKPAGGNAQIDASINILNIGSGDASVYYGKSGENFLLREIKGSPTITVSTSDNLIYIDASGGGTGTYDTSLDPSLAMPNDVGGIPAGTLVNDLKGDTLISLWDSLLFPTVNPTYVAPSNSFNDNATNLQEVAAAISVTYTASFNRGAINLSGSFQDYRAGLPNSYNYSDPSGNTLLTDVSSASLTNIQTVNNYVVVIGTQTWSNTVSYDEGPQPKDNKGNDYDSPLSAGTTGSQSVTIEGVYPIFATTSSISVLTKQALQSMSISTSPTYSMAPESGGNKQTFQLPDKWTGSPTNNPLTGVQTYNTIAGSWEYQGGSAASSLTYWTTSSTTKTIQGVVENYTQYTYNGTDRSTVDIRLIF